ncbi:hypothetical protein PoB_000682300 [Plakobranchus ocellatus]|uniref:Uncharacterized protein n=1 Tax=Plakobranchus ocellatus TaxID=259542 RepID=A0AAV3YDU1_9GAST|nr:hypothetical protein PoB_000682300 [Plakobranchus ocellatus]
MDQDGDIRARNIIRSCNVTCEIKLNLQCNSEEDRPSSSSLEVGKLSSWWPDLDALFPPPFAPRWSAVFDRDSKQHWFITQRTNTGLGGKSSRAIPDEECTTKEVTNAVVIFVTLVYLL